VDRPDTWPPPRSYPRTEALDRPLDSLAGVGPTLKRRLARLGLETVGDAVRYAPRGYQPPVGEQRIADLFGEEEASIVGEVQTVSTRRARRRLTILKARVADDSGSVTAVWFNQPWLADKLLPGTRVRLRGSLRQREFAVRSYDLNGAEATADFAPIYPASEDVTPKRLRELIAAALPRTLGDPLPARVKHELRLPGRADAVWALHQPRSLEEAEAGRRRLAFEELLTLQVGIARRRREREQALAEALGEPGELAARYRETLPFRLTPHQERAIAEIDADLARATPMHRLLQGDVGSGKTVVALYALLRAVESGRQGGLMAPTETLAEQHFLTLEEPCRALGVSCVLLTSALPAKEHAAARAAIASGEAQIAVGTHALIQEAVEFAELAVAVVDEQHRFGVEQRQALVGTARSRGAAGGAMPEGTVRDHTGPESSVPPAATGRPGGRLRRPGGSAGRGRAAGRTPHVLHMTATPIPRTLALTVYGDLAVSEIAEPPANRKPIVTAWVMAEQSSKAYTRLRRHLDDGRQAYVVCPLIEETETSVARAAEAEAERLRGGELRGYRVGLLHGRLRPAERRDLMARFKAGELDVLVATTVIEVGVDVPNATIMIVQEADRFGLAQLHQLRGRVGRGAEQSYCLLVSRAREEVTDSARERLEALVASNDGFELAEKDLEIRGEGQLLGTRQSGLSDLRFTRLRADRRLLELARDEAGRVADTGPLADEVDRVFGDREVAG
jgi:ATP-dependent DNA helicase RecG